MRISIIRIGGKCEVGMQAQVQPFCWASTVSIKQSKMNTTSLTRSDKISPCADLVNNSMSSMFTIGISVSAFPSIFQTTHRHTSSYKVYMQLQIAKHCTVGLANFILVLLYKIQFICLQIDMH